MSNNGREMTADIDNDIDATREARAVAEIKAISAAARYCIQHVIRNHMQIIAGLSEEPTDKGLPHPAQERFKAISEAVQTLSEDMRRIGL